MTNAYNGQPQTGTQNFSVGTVRNILNTDNKGIAKLCAQVSMMPKKDQFGRTYFTRDDLEILKRTKKINEKTQQQKPSAKAYATAPISSTAAAMKAKLKQQQQIQQAPVVMSQPVQMPAPAYSFEQILNSLSEIETNLTDKISELLEKKLDEKLDGMDEVVVELVRCKTENETLRYKINELNKEVYNIKNELSLYKPIGLGFYVKKSVDSSLL